MPASSATGSTQTLEPRLFYVYVPYRNQDAIPIFDTALADFNYAQLFTENRFVGGDRFGDANQVTLALTSRFLRAERRRRRCARPSGQRYYFDAERVGLTPTSPLRTSNDSDILASVGGRARPTLDLRRHDAVQPLPAAPGALQHRGRATAPSSPRC